MAAPALEPAGDAFWRSRAPVLLANPAVPTSGVETLLASGAADGLVLFRTSGSQGAPKLVGLTREALLASARAVNAFLGASLQDTWLRVLPRFHVGGFGVEARAWAAGARCVADEEKWDAQRFREVCEREGIAFSSLVPTQVFDLVRQKLPAPSSLRAIVVGGGELRPVLWRQARALGWPVLASYGLTEAASQVATQRLDEPDPSALTLLPHWQARVSASGTLELAGPALAACYFIEEKNGAWRREDIGPWLHTSDRVALEGGTLRFLGRADRVVKRLGELIDLNDLERALADAAVEAGAFGRVRLRCEPDARAGHAFVLECLGAEEGARVAALFDARQPPFCRLKEVRVARDLHLSPLGKPIL